jgi:flavodoxin I
MKKILVLYYSQTGNTEKMANAVAEGAQNIGNVEVEQSFHVDPEDLASYDAIIVGTPTYHHDMPLDFKKLFEQASVKGVNLKGKAAATFGSYGWSGEAPKLVLEIMKYKFEMQASEPPLLANYSPNPKVLDDCRALGNRVAETLMSKA